MKERIRFGVKIDEALEVEHGWRLNGHGLDGSPLRFECRKLIVSTGRTCDPIYPSFPGQGSFGGPVFVPSDIADRSNCAPLESSELESASVSGGGKSAWDTAFLVAQMGKKVDWIIRPSGFGPCWSLNGLVPGSNNFHGAHVTGIRLLSWLSPSIWQDVDGFGLIRRLFQNTWLGNLLIRGFYTKFRNEMASSYNAADHPERKGLLSDVSPWWRGDTVGTQNFSGDFWKLLETGQVTVHSKEI